MEQELTNHELKLPQFPDLDTLRKNPKVIAYIQKADEQMAAVGYTEHGMRHASRVCMVAYNIATHVGFSTRESELCAISGFLHDIGNLISRHNHNENSALIAMGILDEMGMDPIEIGTVAGAIGNHDEEYGQPISNVASAIILADKSDVHFTRVRNTNPMTFDIHDRVNYAVQKSFLRVLTSTKTISLELSLNTDSADLMEYFEIFLGRMLLCRKAAAFLDYKFKLVANDRVL